MDGNTERNEKIIAMLRDGASFGSISDGMEITSGVVAGVVRRRGLHGVGRRGRKPAYPEIVAMQVGDVLRFPADFLEGKRRATNCERHYKAAIMHSRYGGKGKRFSGMILPGPVLRLERIE